MKVVPQVSAHCHGPVSADIETQVEKAYIRLVMRPSSIVTAVEFHIGVFCRPQQAIVFHRGYVVKGFLLGGKNSKVPGKGLVHNGCGIVVNGESAPVNIAMQRMVRLRLNGMINDYQ